MHPKIDHDKCTGCGTCVDVCPVEVFEMKDDKSEVVQPDECVECETCVENCPENAIQLVD